MEHQVKAICYSDLLNHITLVHSVWLCCNFAQKLALVNCRRHRNPILYVRSKQSFTLAEQRHLNILSVNPSFVCVCCQPKLSFQQGRFARKLLFFYSLTDIFSQKGSLWFTLHQRNQTYERNTKWKQEYLSLSDVLHEIFRTLFASLVLMLAVCGAVTHQFDTNQTAEKCLTESSECLNSNVCQTQWWETWCGDSFEKYIKMDAPIPKKTKKQNCVITIIEAGTQL